MFLSQLLSRTDLYGMKENGEGIIKELLLNANTRYIKFFRYSTNLDEKITIYYSENAKSEYIPYVAPHTEITLEYEKIYNND